MRLQKGSNERGPSEALPCSVLVQVAVRLRRSGWFGEMFGELNYQGSPGDHVDVRGEEEKRIETNVQGARLGPRVAQLQNEGWLWKQCRAACTARRHACTVQSRGWNVQWSSAGDPLSSPFHVGGFIFIFVFLFVFVTCSIHWIKNGAKFRRLPFRIQATDRFSFFLK